MAVENVPPLIAEIAAYCLMAALVFLFYHSLQLRHVILEAPHLAPPPVPSPQPHSAPQREPQPRMEYHIEPSPVPGQKIPYPTISSVGEEFDVSVVVPIQNLSAELTFILDSICQYFAARDPLTYEVLVVDRCSSDSTRSEALAFARHHDCVRVLHIPRVVSMSSACLIGCTRTRGRWIFLYNPADKIPVAEFAKFENKARAGLERATEVLVCAAWKDEPDDPTILKSTLNAFLQFVCERLLAIVGIGTAKRARTFMMNRDAARIIYSLVRLNVPCYDIEMLVIAATVGIEVKTAKLMVPDPGQYTTASTQRFEIAVNALKAVFMHSFRDTSVRYLPVRQPKSVAEL